MQRRGALFGDPAGAVTAAVATPAIVLAAVRYSETSKVVRLATRDLGVQSAIAKGALRPRSRFGAALQLLSEGQAQLLVKEGRELHTLAAFDAQHIRTGLATDLDRYAAANALAEVMLRCAPPAPHPESFDLFRQGLDAIEIAPSVALGVLPIRVLWGLVGSLGFAPALDACARDGAPLQGATVGFSFREGGALCAGCAPGRSATELKTGDLDELRQLAISGHELPDLDARHVAAHRRLVARWVREHLGEGTPLPALDFWLERRWTRQ
ncbi:MAG TPA: DNA repair protein RecO [Gemmatimonadales bacterium]|nr:DNA repair protein RecO [Gemmatimonadales bacterium]